jgi:hypothetical protein
MWVKLHLDKEGEGMEWPKRRVVISALLDLKKCMAEWRHYGELVRAAKRPQDLGRYVDWGEGEGDDA